MARRINSSFLITLTVVVLGGGLVLLVAGKLLRPTGNAAKFTASANAALKANDLKTARDLFAKASSADPSNTAILVSLGDVHARMVNEDQDNMRLAMQAWNRAVSLDARCEPALNRMLASYWSILETMPPTNKMKPGYYSQAREICDKLIAVNADNLDAQEKKQIATIRQWSETNDLPSQQVVESIKALTALMKKDPGNGDVPFYLAGAKIRQAHNQEGAAEDASILAQYTAVATMMDDARKAQPKNAVIQYRAFEIYQKLQVTDPRTSSSTQHPPDDRYTKRAGEAILAAKQFASDKDSYYDEIQFAIADWLSSQGKFEQSDKVIRDLYDSHRDDQRARLAMARLLMKNQGNRDQAIAILKQEVVIPPDAIGFRALTIRELQVQTLRELAILRLADLPILTDATKRNACQAEITDAISRLRGITGPKSALVLELEGRLHLARNEIIDAVKSLEEAQSQIPDDRPNVEVMTLLANAYVRTGQPGAAQGLLDKVVHLAPSSAGPRIMLAHLLLQQGDLTSGERYLKELHAQFPDMAELKDLDATADLLRTRQDPKQNAANYPQLPESTKDEQVHKAQIAMALGKPDESIRLLRMAITSDPKDAQLYRVLGSIYESRGQQERAQAVIDEGLKVLPDDKMLKVLSLRLTKATPADLYASVKAIIEQGTDEYTREMQLCDLERGPGGHPDQALPHLERAAQLKPTDVHVLSQLYELYVSKGDFAKAKPYLNKLVDMGADQCGGLLYRERFALAQGEYTEAESLAKQLVQQYGEFAASWMALAKVQARRGEFDAAIHAYGEVRKRQPKQYEALRGLIDCDYALSKITEAKSLLIEGRRDFPNDPTIQEMYLNHLVNYGNPADAISDRKKLLMDHLDDPTYYLALASTYFQAARHAATTPSSSNPGDAPAQNPVSNLLTQAFSTLNNGAARFPDDFRFYGQMAEMYQFANRMDKAVEVLNTFQQRPAVRDTPEPYLLEYEMYNRAHMYDKAEACLGDALVRADHSQNKLEIRLRLVNVMLQAKKYDQALATLDGAGANDDPRVIHQRIQIYMSQGNLDKAKAACLEALKQHNSADMRNMLASVLIDTGHVAEAQQQLAEAASLDPRNVITRYLHALSLAKQPTPDYTTAIHELAALRDQDQRNAEVRLLLAELYRSNGNDDAAIHELADGLQKVPLSREIRLALIKLYRGTTPPNYAAARDLAISAQQDPALRSDIEWARQEALCWMSLKDQARAILTMRERVIARAPQNLEYWQEFLDMILEFKDYNAVLRESDRLLAQGKDAWWLRQQRAISFANKPDPQPQLALEEFDRALLLADAAGNPGISESILRSMSQSIGANGYDEAVKRTIAREAHDPDNRWHLLLAALYRGKGDYASATRTIDAMLADPANRPTDRRLLVVRAATDVYQHAPHPNYNKLREMYVELLSLAPRDLLALNNLAYLLAENMQPPQPQQAKMYSGKAYDITRQSGSPNDMIFDTHGWILALCGGDDARDGVKILQTVVERHPNFVEGHYHLGVAYMRQPRPDPGAAVEELKKAMNLIATSESGGQTLDPALKDKIQQALAQATDAKTKAAGKVS